MAQTTIAPLIADQFPRFYQESGQQFITFLTEYYKWFDLTFDRQLLDQKDIDLAADSVLPKFKALYLPDVEYSGDVRLFVKHSLDLYRSKGSEQAIKLLFNMFFAANVEVAYPRDHIFSTSIDRWIAPVTIETTKQLPSHKIITGGASKATGFVDRTIVINRGGNFFVAYLTNITGTFEAGELLTVDNLVVARVQGAVSPLLSFVNAYGFQQNQEITLDSPTGFGGRAVVVNNTKLAVISSGFGYKRGELVSLNGTGTTVAVDLTGTGRDVGYFETDKSSTSSANALFDGYYYQPHSYEIRSPYDVDKYASAVFDTVHVAGMKMFGAIEIVAVNNTNLSANSSTSSTVTYVHGYAFEWFDKNNSIWPGV